MVGIAGTLLVTKDNHVLLQRRDGNAPRSPHKLSLFGGHAENDETSLETAVRELAEEISLDVTQLQFEPVVSFTMAGYEYNMFKTVVPTTDFKVFEGVGYEEYPIDEVLQRTDLTESAQRTITAVLKGEK
jgi:8-oxo-dGTP pyrophosphatase MutT (NUDIX family)